MPELLKRLYLPIIFLVLVWIIFGLTEGLGLNMGIRGIYPRKWYGLLGIITAPLLHSNVGHLVSNSLPLAGLTTMLFLLYKKISYYSFFIIYLLTGLTVWLFARQVYHVGASGLVYGLVSFVFFNGIFRKNPVAIILSLVVTLIYLGSGYFFGILPNQERISWESHLFGAVVGGFVSFLLKDVVESDMDEKEPFPEEEQYYFFPKDIFDKTIEERILEQQSGEEDPLL